MEMMARYLMTLILLVSAAAAGAGTRDEPRYALLALERADASLRWRFEVPAPAPGHILVSPVVLPAVDAGDDDPQAGTEVIGDRRGGLYAFCTDVEAADSTLASRLVAPEVMDVSVENRTPWGRLVKTVRVSRPIEDLEVLGRYPFRVSARPDEHSFQVAVPPRGVSVIRVRCAD